MTTGTVAKRPRKLTGAKVPRGDVKSPPPALPPITGALPPALDAPPAPPKKKLVLVDGASFNHPSVRQTLNASKTNFGALLQILVSLDEGEVVGKPIFTVPISLPDYVQKDISVSGFQVEPRETTFEEDDYFLIKKIRAADPTEIGSIVLVTNDGSFADAAREAKARGIKMYWCTVEGTNIRGQAMVGAATKQLIEAEFVSVDMRQYADQLRRRPWEERPRQNFQQTSPPPVEPKTVITFKAAVPTRDLTAFVASLQPILQQHNIEVNFSS